MLRHSFLLILACSISAHGQQAVPPAASREVLKALPIGGDDESATTTMQNVAPLERPSVTPVEPVAPRPSPLDVKPTGDDAVRLQIFLDESNFGPGVIDGKPGRFTEQAVFFMERG